MLPWGLPHRDWFCQKTGQISSEALRLKGGRVVPPPFSKQCQLEEVPQGHVQVGFEYLKVWTFCSKPQPCQEDHPNLLLEPDSPAVCVSSPTLSDVVPMLAGILAAQVPVVHGQPFPHLKSHPQLASPKRISGAQPVPLPWCSVDHLAARVAQQGDSSDRVTLAWPMQRPQTLPQNTTGSLQATTGSHSPATLPKLLFAQTPTPPASLNFGLPLLIQHSTSGDHCLNLHQLLPQLSPTTNSQLITKCSPGNQGQSTFQSPLEELKITKWHISPPLTSCLLALGGAVELVFVQILPSSLFTHKSVDDETQDFGAEEGGIRSHKVFTCSHWTGTLNLSALVLHFKHISI